MRRRVTMGLLALGVVGGFGMELHRMKSCGGGCPDERRASFAAAADTQVAPQAAPVADKSEHKKGGHCDGWKSRWNQDNQQPEPTPEAAVTTAQK